MEKVVVILLIWCCTSGLNAQVNFNYDSSLSSPTYADPDQHGYRYCAYWKLSDGTTIHSTCDPFAMKRCGKTLDFGFECCSGFKEVGTSIFESNSFGNNVCGQPLPQWKSCPDILKMLPKVDAFASMMSVNEMTSENPSEAFTIFAPQASSGDLSRIYPSSDASTSNPVFYHVVRGRYYVSNLRNNQELPSVYENQKLKVVKYSFGIVCIDCVEITKADIECKNAVIHTIRKPLVPRSGANANRKNIFEAISSDPDTQSFANDIPYNLQEELKNTRSGIWYTILAVKSSNWDSSKGKYSGNDREKVVRNHIMTKLYCSTALTQSNNKISTFQGEPITVQCNTQGNQEVRTVTDLCGEKRTFVSKDNMAANGVYHVIDGPLVPLSARSFSDILKNSGCTKSSFFQSSKFANFIKDCDLYMKPNSKYTILMPMDISFDWWKNYPQFQSEYNRFLNDKEYRCRVARYHIVEQNPELDRLATLWHEQKGYKTNNRDLLHEVDYFLKDRDHSDLYFHYSPVVNFKENKHRDGSMYQISRINVIPEKFIVDIVKEHPNLKTTNKQVIKADMDKKVFKPNRPLNLFLATLDQGLIDPKTGSVDKVIAAYDGKSLDNYLLLHSVPLYLWGGDIGYFKPNTVHRFMSRAGIELIFWMDSNGVMKIGYDGLPKDQWAEVVKFNLHAKDGIVWLLKKPLPCPKKLCPHKVVVIDYDLFDVYVSSCQFKELPGITSDAQARQEFNARPIKLAEENPDKCVIYKQPTHKASKKLTP